MSNKNIILYSFHNTERIEFFFEKQFKLQILAINKLFKTLHQSLLTFLKKYRKRFKYGFKEVLFSFNNKIILPVFRLVEDLEEVSEVEVDLQKVKHKLIY